MRYSKILLAIVLISMLVFGSTMSTFAVGETYNLDVSVAEGSKNMGTVTGSGDYAYEGDVHVSALPNAGYRFVGWEVCFNGAGMNPLAKPASFTCNLSSVNVYVPNVYMRATFEAIPTTPTNSEVIVHYINFDTNVRLIPEVKISGIIGKPYVTEAKVFANFELFKTTNNTTGTFGEVQGHVDYYYKAVVITDPPVNYTVTGVVSPLASGTITGTAAYPYDSMVTLTATPSLHYVFDKWELPVGVTPTTDLDEAVLKFKMPKLNFEAKAIFKEDFKVMATIKYLDASNMPIKVATQQEMYLGAYTLAPPAIPGYTFGVSSNASGTIIPTSTNFEVIHKYYVPQVITNTNTVTNTVTETVYVNVPATTAPATTEVITTEAVPLGAPGPLNFDELIEDETLPATEMTTEAEEVMEEEVPLADALPQTGQLSVDMFYGIGGLVSGLGLWLKRKK